MYTFVIRNVLLIVFLSVWTCSSVVALSVVGTWTSETYRYTAHQNIVRQKIQYIISDSIVQLKLHTFVFSEFYTTRPLVIPPLTYHFRIHRFIITSRAKGRIIVQSPAGAYQVIHCYSKAKNSLRIHFIPGKTYTLAQATSITPVSMGQLFFREAYYWQQQQLPVVPAITARSFAQLQKAVKKQLKKRKVKKMKAAGVDESNLKNEALKTVFLLQGFNPYLSWCEMIKWQQQQMEQRAMALLKRQLKKQKERLVVLKATPTQSVANKNRYKAARQSTQLAWTLTNKKLEYLILRQQIRLKQAPTPQELAHIKQIKQVIEGLTQQQFVLPQEHTRFAPVKVGKD
ncbi:hypothetical protein [Microscilla marina]|uniref:Uncharacterized protein n=1 Tax=Microscilla marina ATCC 23134 TaxID=313606 RepID=A1ZJP9_MICM2|nr:hypothetical protein [Microscilla marina]EAY29352.1 hypothetical protein M23134_01408 [Microscilla marina ATCC 23134]